MVVAFDQGNPKDIHPIVKDTVGWRLSQLALGKVYGKKVVCQEPEFKKMTKTADGSDVYKRQLQANDKKLRRIFRKGKHLQRNRHYCKTAFL